MKKIVVGMMALLLAIAQWTPALGAAPDKDSLKLTIEQVGGEILWTRESYPEIWIAPSFYEYIIEGRDDYPPHFLRFCAPENALPMKFGYDDAYFLDHNALMSYSYAAYDRVSFEVFLEDVEAENILMDGSEGTAIYVASDKGRAYGLIDIKDLFGKTAKLQIVIVDHTRKLSASALGQEILGEVERVKSSWQLEELEGFWSEGVIASVQLAADRAPILATVDTSGLTVIGAESDKLHTSALVNGYANDTEVEIGSYSYVMSKEDSEVSEVTMDDGRAFRVYLSEYTGYAVSVLLEEGKHDAQYLSIKIDCDTAEFEALLKDAYGRIALEVEPAD